MNPTKLHDDLVKFGTEKARTAAYWSTCDRLRKQVRAKWITHYINEGNTVGKSEQLAILEREYKRACRRCERAERDAGIAAVEYAAAQAWFESWRTLEATKRAEMRLV